MSARPVDINGIPFHRGDLVRFTNGYDTAERRVDQIGSDSAGKYVAFGEQRLGPSTARHLEVVRETRTQRIRTLSYRRPQAVRIRIDGEGPPRWAVIACNRAYTVLPRWDAPSVKPSRFGTVSAARRLAAEDVARQARGRSGALDDAVARVGLRQVPASWRWTLA